MSYFIPEEEFFSPSEIKTLRENLPPEEDWCHCEDEHSAKYISSKKLWVCSHCGKIVQLS